VIEDLLRLQWWILSLGVLIDLPLSDIAACVERLKEIRGS
jgi:hypothetical protein